MQCHKCEKTELNLTYHPTQGFLCEDCLGLSFKYLTDEFIVVDGKVEIRPLVFTEDKGLDWLYILFDRQYNMVWTKQYKALLAKGYTPIGICRTMEYLVQACKRKLTQPGVGLAPYYYDKATEFYSDLHKLMHTQMQQLATQQTQVRVIKRRK